MKNVRINTGYVGLVYRRGELTEVLTAGKHFVNSFMDTVEIHRAKDILNSATDISLLMLNPVLKSLTTLVEVADGEICMVHKNKLFETVLPAGRYVYFKNLMEYEFTVLDFTFSERILDPNVLKYANSNLSNYIRKIEVAMHEEAVLLVDGEYKMVLSAGAYYYYRNTTNLAVKHVDLRMQAMEITGQEMLTKDKANLRVNFNLQFKVVDTVKSVLKNKEYEKQLYLIAQLLLREIVGTLQLDELLENKEAITKYVMENIGKASTVLGVEVYYAGVKDIILPGEMKEIMNQVLVAQKKAQANVITRREETASVRSMLNTAKLLEENEMLYKLKEMEYLEKIADKVGEITVSGGANVLKQLKQLF
ncbi:MAG: peptidase [Bacteroidetes bacterium]|nr:MAG: peptidase [Bacteroidota bacterium]